MNGCLKRHWIICIAGYMQKYSTTGGVLLMWAELDEKHAGDGTVVLFFSWNSNWKDIAEFISRNSIPNPRVDVLAYSWGVGYGLRLLAKYLNRRSIKVTNAVTSDGIGCMGPKFIRAVLAYTRLPRINLGDTVENLYVFRQDRENKRIEFDGWKPKLFGLKGHKVLLNGDWYNETVISDGPEHRHMDELELFRDKCRKVASS